MFSQVNSPGGIQGGILRAIVATGEATPEQIAELEALNKEWEEAGLKPGDWATRTQDGRLVAVNSAAHRADVAAYLSRFKTMDGQAIDSPQLVNKLLNP